MTQATLASSVAAPRAFYQSAQEGLQRQSGNLLRSDALEQSSRAIARSRHKHPETLAREEKLQLSAQANTMS